MIILRYLLLPLCACLMQCQSSKEKEPEGMTVGRSMQRISNYDITKESQFDRSFNTAGAGNRGGGEGFGKKGFHTSSFTGTKEFAAGEFSQANQVNRMGTTDSRYGLQSSRLDREFSTKDSRWGSKSARQQDKTFRGGDRSFSSNSYAPAQKSIDKGTRPLIDNTPGPIDQGANAYSEAEVKRLLGR
jgi:hypothetical protein